ncbi:MAG: hypothetical protein JJ964_14085 [Rhizobiales bacterium]|nr:hypothetical protein [Hyphomicrobiales bacterium]
MALLDNLIAVLERWDVWKELKSNADKIPELEKRITELEQKLERCPGEACPKCGHLTLRRTRAAPARHTYECEREECSYIEHHNPMEKRYSR